MTVGLTINRTKNSKRQTEGRRENYEGITGGKEV